MSATANRLTSHDCDTISRRIAETLHVWGTNGGGHARAVTVDALTRVGAGAIGCGLDDLRDSELAEIRAMAERRIGGVA